MAGKYSKKKRISGLEIGLAVVVGLLALVLLVMVGLIACQKLEGPEETAAVTTETTTETTEETTMATAAETTVETTTEATTEATQPETTAATVPETTAPEETQKPAPSSGGSGTGGSNTSGTNNGGGNVVESGGGESAGAGHAHDFGGNSKTDYNCETGGSRTYYCRTCDYYYTEELPARGQHTLMDMPSNMADGPSCTRYGKMFRVCTKCNYILTVDDPNQPPLGHKYRETVVAPTTDSQGYTQHTCERCSDSYQDNFVPALPAETAPPQTQAPAPETQPAASEGEG